MQILPPVEQEIRRAIRDERARDPIIPITKLQENLERRFCREFKRTYLTKLCNKVARQTMVEIDRAKIEERMAFTRENYRLMREELLTIVYWNRNTADEGAPRPQARDVVEAAKTIAMLDLAILKAEIETGMYKKPIEAIAKEIRYDPLPDDVRTVIIAAIERTVPVSDG
jgi:hypothetical protein